MLVENVLTQIFYLYYKKGLVIGLVQPYFNFTYTGKIPQVRIFVRKKSGKYQIVF